MYGRVREGKLFCNKVVDFLKKRMEIERDYAKKLQALCKSAEHERGTLQTGWTTFKNETDTIAKKHAEIADGLAVQSIDPIIQWMKETEKARKDTRNRGRTVIKDLANSDKNHKSCKAAYEAARRQQDKAQEEYDKISFNAPADKKVQKFAQTLASDTKKAEQADAKYQESVKVCRTLMLVIVE